jgi:hypothetical protein
MNAKIYVGDVSSGYSYSIEGKVPSECVVLFEFDANDPAEAGEIYSRLLTKLRKIQKKLAKRSADCLQMLFEIRSRCQPKDEPQ